MTLREVLLGLYLYAGPVGILGVAVVVSYHLAREIGGLRPAGRSLFPEEELEEQDRQRGEESEP